MKDKNPEQFKNILNKFGLDPPENILIEIEKNIPTLAELIKTFEARKSNIKTKNKKHGKIK